MRSVAQCVMTAASSARHSAACLPNWCLSASSHRCLPTVSCVRRARELSDDERRAVAVFLTGKPLGTIAAPVIVPKCARPAPPFSKVSASAWNGWGATPTNARFQRQP